MFNNLSDLDLSYNRIGDEGAIAVTRAVSHIEGLRFRIWNHRISEKGSSEIASLVQDVDRNFHHLTISSDEMLEKIDILLHNMQDNESNHIKVVELKISRYEIFQSRTLPAIIKQCSKLQTLDITLSNFNVLAINKC